MRNDALIRGRRPVAGLLLLAATGWSCSSGSQAQPAARGGGATPVAVAEVTRRDISRDVVLAGPVEPIRLVGVNARAAGSILAVRVVEGDRVQPGQLMAELDGRETNAQFERARAVLQNAKAAFERAEQMHQSRIITDAEFEVARASYGTAQSDVDLWETRRDFTRIVAPTAGVVTTKYIEAGTAVTNNQRVFDIADDALLVVRVQMSELDVVHVKSRDSVAITLDAQPGAELHGWVRRVFPSADAQTRLVPVEVALNRAPSGVTVRPGFLARVHFDLERRPATLVVPASAVGAGGTGTFVYVVQADTLIRRPVATGMTSEGWVQVDS
ncbi:MAG: efflux RND transporter periplasmic adaptor subunit, partial [Gemmatimonadales bacterium]